MPAVDVSYERAALLVGWKKIPAAPDSIAELWMASLDRMASKRACVGHARKPWLGLTQLGSCTVLVVERTRRRHFHCCACLWYYAATLVGSRRSWRQCWRRICRGPGNWSPAAAADIVEACSAEQQPKTFSAALVDRTSLVRAGSRFEWTLFAVETSLLIEPVLGESKGRLYGISFARPFFLRFSRLLRGQAVAQGRVAKRMR